MVIFISWDKFIISVIYLFCLDLIVLLSISDSSYFSGTDRVVTNINALLTSFSNVLYISYIFFKVIRSWFWYFCSLEKAFFLLKSLIKNYEVIFILGNHESKFEIGQINFLNEYVIDDIHFIHEALHTSVFQISGHFHPVATVKSNIKKITAKCLLHTNNHIILPSFGQYTGGLNITNPALKPFVNHKSYVYMLTKKSIYKFTSKEVEI